MKQNGRYSNDPKAYHREYMRTHKIYNKFTGKQENYKGVPCPDGFVRHHTYYDMEDINEGITFITASEHMEIHQDIKFGRREPIPVLNKAHN